MDQSVGKEFLNVYKQISRLQDDIAKLGKDCYETMLHSSDIPEVPDSLSEFKNDIGYITSDEVDCRFDNLTSVYLKTGGAGKQKCTVPTEFKELHAVTKDADDSSTNVATTEFVHSIVKSGTDGVLSCVMRRDEAGKFATTQYVDTAVQLSEHDVKQYSDQLIAQSKQELESEITEAIAQIDIPTKTSDLTNDSGFITINDIPEDLVTSVNGQTGDVLIDIPDVPTKLSELTNDVGYITDAGVTSVNNRTGAVTVQENVLSDWTSQSGPSQILNKPALKRIATTADYGDLENAPDLSIYAESANLSTVATSGSYTDLWNTPDLSVYAQSSSLATVATSGSYSDLANTPDLSIYAQSSNLATIATSGSYADLLDKPIFDVIYETTTFLEIQNALLLGKIPVCRYDDREYLYIAKIGNNYYFTSAFAPQTYILAFLPLSPYWDKFTRVAENEQNKVLSVVLYLSSQDNYPSTKAVYDEYQRKPVVVWEVASGQTGLLSSEQDITESPTWQLTNLDMTPYKRIKIYTKAGKKTSGVGLDASNTPAAVLEMSLDDRAASPTGGHFVGSVIGQKPNDANRFFSVTCAISSDKTSFAVLRMSSLYGTAATGNNDANGYVFKIEGYFD